MMSFVVYFENIELLRIFAFEKKDAKKINNTQRNLTKIFYIVLIKYVIKYYPCFLKTSKMYCMSGSFANTFSLLISNVSVDLH